MNRPANMFTITGLGNRLILTHRKKKYTARHYVSSRRETDTESVMCDTMPSTNRIPKVVMVCSNLRTARGLRYVQNLKDLECTNHYLQECTIIQITLHLGKNQVFLE